MPCRSRPMTPHGRASSVPGKDGGWRSAPSSWPSKPGSCRRVDGPVWRAMAGLWWRGPRSTGWRRSGPSGLPPERPSAAAFGRSIGMRDGGRFLALIAAGHTPATRVTHPKFGTEILVLSEADIAAFHRRFATTTTLAAEWGEHRNTVVARLEAAPSAANLAGRGRLRGALSANGRGAGRKMTPSGGRRSWRAQKDSNPQPAD